MELFEPFLRAYPPCGELRKPDEKLLEQFRNRLPAELLEFWQEYGFGFYGGGLIQVINPNDYADSLSIWLGGKNPNRIPILLTAFGNILYYRRLSETEEDVCLLDIHCRRTVCCSYSFTEFIENFILDEEIAEALLHKQLFQDAVSAKGVLQEGEIFLFAPALILGGSETVDCIQKGNAAVHQQLLFQMGASGYSNE